MTTNLSTLLLCAGVAIANVSQVNAGVSSGWFDYFVGGIGERGADSFRVVGDNGLILSRLKRDYAAFTFGERRLSDAERESEPLDLSEFNFVVGFEVCPNSANFFDGRVYKVNYRYHTDESDILIDEILDINEFFNRVSGSVQPSIVSSTKDDLVTVYTMGVGNYSSVEFRVTLSKGVHYIDITATAAAVCQ